MPPSDGEARWQCVMILWGDKYDVALVNRLTAAIARNASHQPRFVLLTDRDRPGLDASVSSVRLPEYWLDPQLQSAGCHTKLAMFEDGLLQSDLPAVYVDLDTVVTGDMARAPALLKREDGLMLLQSAAVPLGWVGRALKTLTKGRKYARGNSSVVIFHPAHCPHIARRFKELRAADPAMSFRPMMADERFMSWAAQDTVEAIPSSFAVKFPTEFMSRYTIFSYVWALLPWVRARRAHLTAVTLCGMEVKPETLMHLPEGGQLTDAKGRKLIWSDFILGRTRRDILAFYADSAG